MECEKQETIAFFGQAHETYYTLDPLVKVPFIRYAKFKKRSYNVMLHDIWWQNPIHDLYCRSWRDTGQFDSLQVTFLWTDKIYIREW